MRQPGALGRSLGRLHRLRACKRPQKLQPKQPQKRQHSLTDAARPRVLQPICKRLPGTNRRSAASNATRSAAASAARTAKARENLCLILKSVSQDFLGGSSEAGYRKLIHKLHARRVTDPAMDEDGIVTDEDTKSNTESGIGCPDAVRALQRSLQRSPRCRRARVRIVRLRSPEDLGVL